MITIETCRYTDIHTYKHGHLYFLIIFTVIIIIIISEYQLRDNSNLFLAEFQRTCLSICLVLINHPLKSIRLYGIRSLCIQISPLPFTHLITFMNKLKSFCFHSCSVCTIGKLFILSTRVFPPLFNRYYHWRDG